MQIVPDQAVGVVIAATIAATLAFLTLLVTKEQKTSEFRQAWIDALRSDIAEFLARVHVIADAHTAGISDNDAQAWSAIREDWIVANNSMLRIKLRLNPKEKKCKNILALIDKLEEEYLDNGTVNYKIIGEVEKSLVSETHVFLKKEWKRVKRGEPVFAFVKYSSGLAIGSALLLFLYSRILI